MGRKKRERSAGAAEETSGARWRRRSGFRWRRNRGRAERRACKETNDRPGASVALPSVLRVPVNDAFAQIRFDRCGPCVRRGSSRYKRAHDRSGAERASEPGHLTGMRALVTNGCHAHRPCCPPCLSFWGRSLEKKKPEQRRSSSWWH